MILFFLKHLPIVQNLPGWLCPPGMPGSFFTFTPSREPQGTTGPSGVKNEGYLAIIPKVTPKAAYGRLVKCGCGLLSCNDDNDY